MNLSLLSIPVIITFALILIRVSGMLVSAPIFSGNSIPAQVKVGIALALSLLLFPLHAGHLHGQAPVDLPQFIWIGGQEFVLGLMIGLVADFTFAALRMAGEYLAVQMGLSIATALDPMSGAATPLLGQIYYIFGVMLFLNANIHHALIAAVNKSFVWIPLGQGITHFGKLCERFVLLTGDMFVLGLLVGMPVMGVLLVTEAAMAFVAKVMPQMNIFIVGLPIKSLVGFVVMAATLPMLATLLGDEYSELTKHLMGLYQGV